jgi:hypothetical protein
MMRRHLFAAGVFRCQVTSWRRPFCKINIDDSDSDACRVINTIAKYIEINSNSIYDLTLARSVEFSKDRMGSCQCPTSCRTLRNHSSACPTVRMIWVRARVRVRVGLGL